MSGFVYVMTNDSMPGLVKIGHTINTPHQRAEQLNTTGVPTPFRVEFAVLVKDPEGVEREIHDCFSDKRVNQSREFFAVDVHEVVERVADASVSEWDLTVGHGDAWIDPVNLNEYAQLYCDGHPFEVVRIIDWFTKEEWEAATARYRLHIQKRLSQIENRHPGEADKTDGSTCQTEY